MCDERITPSRPIQSLQYRIDYILFTGTYGAANEGEKRRLTAASINHSHLNADLEISNCHCLVWKIAWLICLCESQQLIPRIWGLPFELSLIWGEQKHLSASIAQGKNLFCRVSSCNNHPLISLGCNNNIYVLEHAGSLLGSSWSNSSERTRKDITQNLQYPWVFLLP